MPRPRRLALYAAAASLLAAGAISASMAVAHAADASTRAASGQTHLIKGFENKCVDDNGNSNSPGAHVQIWACNSNDPAQSWGNSNNELTHDGLCANDAGSGGSGSRVILWTCNGAANEIWTHQSNGELVLKANGGKLCLNDPAYATANGTQLIVYACQDTANEQWSLPLIGPAHVIKGYASKCVDDNENSSSLGTKIQIWGCNNDDDAQLWEYTNGELVHNGMCANDSAFGGSGSHVILWTCNGAANEIWTHQSNGEFVLKANGGTLCLNDPAYSTANGTQLIVYACQNTANEHWTQP
jgi:non-reducing end alpha-L-arabinofuranosidase